MKGELKNEVEGEAAASHRLLPSYRLLVAVLLGVGSGLAMMTRFNITIGVLCMVDGPPGSSAMETTALETHQRGWRPPQQRNTSGSRLSDLLLNTTSLDALTDHHSGNGEFDWDRRRQGLLLSSFYYGYTLTLTLGGWLSDRLPAHHVLTSGICSQGVAALLTPIAARTDFHLLLALRALQGIFCSGVLAACTVMLRNWGTPSEHSTLFSIIWGINYLISGLGLPMASFLCDRTGWTGVFYLMGIVPVIWTILAWILLTLSPEDCSFCSEKESRFIVSQHLHPVASRKFKPEQASHKPPALPILAILTNPQVLIVCMCYTTFAWFYYSLNTMLPTFLKDTAGVDIGENGVMSGLPTMCMTAGVMFGGRVFDYLLTSRGLTRTTVRKLMTFLGALIPAALVSCILVLPPAHPYLTVSLLCCCNVLAVLVVAGSPLSAGLEIAPQYTGIIWGLAATFGSAAGIFAPLIATAMTPNGSIAEWRSFFLITVVLNVVMTLVVLCFWRSEVQPFARLSDAEKPIDSRQEQKDDPQRI